MTCLPRRIALLVAFCLAMVAIPASTSYAAFGDLDPSFDADGAMFHALDDPGSEVRDPRVAQAPDGTLVAVALGGCSGCTVNQRTFDGDMQVIRVSAAGAVIDVEVLPIEDIGDVYDIRVLADGSVTVVSRHDGNILHITRLGADLEPLGPPTLYTPDVCDGSGQIDDAAIRTDGEIVGLWDFCSDLDEQTDTRGQEFNEIIVDEVSAAGARNDRTDLSAAMNWSDDLALRPDGVIHVLGGIGDGPVVVARLLPDGELDPAYDEDGRAFATPDREPQQFNEPGAFAVDGAGRATVGLCCTGGEWQLLRFDSAGEPDASFGPEGVATIAAPASAQGMQLSTQADDKLLVVANQHFSSGSRGAGTPGIVVSRILSDGTPEPGFGTDGFSIVNLDDERRMYPYGPAVEQSDGALVVPVGLEFGRPSGRAFVDAPDQSASHLMLFRLLGRDPAPPVQETPQQQQQQQQPVVQQQQQQPRRCASRRTLRIRLRTGRPKGEKSPIASARVIVRGKRVKVTRRGGRHTARINLRTLPPGRFSVKIRLVLADGGKVRETRRYRTCAKKIQRQLKPLRTRAPRSARG